MLNQKCTVWSYLGLTSTQKPKYGSPTVFNCRWQDKQQQVKTPTGELKQSQAIVYVTNNVTINDRVYLGSSTETNPDTAFKIIAYEQMVGIDGDSAGYKLYI